MRRRHLFTVVAVGSRLLCAASLAFAWWGYQGSPDARFVWAGEHHVACLRSEDGTISLILSDGWPDARWALTGSVRTVGPFTLRTVHHLIVIDTTFERGFLSDGTTTGTVTYRGIRTNVLYLTAFTLVAPVVWCIRWALRQPQPGRCPTCGYDLRATPDRCSECGTVAVLPRAVAVGDNR